MSSTVSTTTGGVVVVTHVHPVAPAAAAAAAEQPQHYVGLQKFKTSRPQALGTIQIMVGLMVLLFGLAWTPLPDSPIVYSGIFVWGAGFYITAGSLTVAAGRRASRCLVNCALSFSIIAAAAAASSVIVYGLDAALTYHCYGWYPGDYPYEDRYDCSKHMSRMQGVVSVLAGFHFLEFVIAVITSWYGCYTTCNCCDEQPSVVVVHRQTATFPTATFPTVTQQTQNTQTVPEPRGFTAPPEPPPYSSSGTN